MADQTSIEWTDSSWNPVTGCTEVSPGCDHCYAKTFAERWRGTPGHHFERGFDVVLRPERLEQPLRWKRPRRIFVNSMSDLFHDRIPDEYIAQVFAVMSLAPQHTFQVLTKRHGRMRSLLNSLSFRIRVATIEYQIAEGIAADLDGDQLPVDPSKARAARESRRLPDGGIPPRWPLPNVWMGVSVESQQWADIRIPALRATPAAVRFLSMEPLLGPVDLDLFTPRAPSLKHLQHIGPGVAIARPNVDWVIVGGESGHGARPMHPAWVRSLRDQCTTAGVPFLFKQWGEHVTVGQMTETATADWEIKNGSGYPEETVARLGKKAAGRDLDGRTWDEFPEAVNSRG